MRTLQFSKFIILILIVVLLAACGGEPPTPAFDFTPPAEASSGPVEPPSDGSLPENAAIVNGVPIAYETYQRELARFEAGQRALGFELNDESGYRRQVLDLLIEQELTRQKAAVQGIVVSDEAVQAEIQSMISDKGEDYFNSWLAGNFYSRQEFIEVIRLELVTSQLLDPVLAAVPTSAPHVHARHILVDSEALAQDILGRIQAGEDFATLAAEYSVDVTSKDNGGDLGWFPPGGLLVPEVEETAFALQPGQISGVISSAWGYHIVQTIEYSEARDIHPETRQRLKQRAIDEWRVQLRAGADIQILVTF